MSPIPRYGNVEKLHILIQLKEMDDQRKGLLLTFELSPLSMERVM